MRDESASRAEHIFRDVLAGREGVKSPEDAALALHGAGDVVGEALYRLSEATSRFVAGNEGAAAEAEEARLRVVDALDHTNQVHYLVMGRELLPLSEGPGRRQDL
jgi:hypothetical protein